MKPIRQKCKECKIVFFACLVCSIGLMIGGFMVPPTGVIDGSILEGSGILFLFAALATGAHAIELGYDLKVQKGDATVTINNNGSGDEADN